MKIYTHYGFNDFILCLGYKGQSIKNFFFNYYSMINDCTVDLSQPNRVEYHDRDVRENWKVTLVNTGVDTMTGARIAMIKKYIGKDENFMMTYGDGLADVDIKALVEFHEKHGKLVTVTGVHPSGRFGEMELGDNNLVNSFAEKPQVSEGRINGGFLVMRREFIDEYLNEDSSLILEQAPLTRCAHDGELISFNHNGFWQPMDTHREYIMLNDLWKKGSALWKVWD